MGAMILVQQTEQTCPKVKDFRALYQKVITDKHEDVMAKFGAILAQGIIDAGGRNVTVSLQSRTGHTNMLVVVGMLVFTQYWYWFPLSHFLSLAFQPTAIIGLNSNLDMPVAQFKSSAKPSMYGYTPNIEEKKKEDKEKEEGEEKKKEAEPLFEMLANPARVMKAQLKVVTLEDARYRPMKDLSIGGIVMLNRTDKGDKDEEIVEPMEVNKATTGSEEEGDEPAPPEPFEWKEGRLV